METNNKSKKVRVVVIDSGIDVNQYDLKDNVVGDVGLRFDSNGYLQVKSNHYIEHDHGTMVAATIKLVSPNVEFYSINILDKDLSANGKLLINALDYCKNYNPDIVHLSLGTTSIKYRYSLKKSINSLIRNNIIIVAAAQNQGAKSYPAYFKNVVGVKGHICNNYNEIYYKNNFFYGPLHLSPNLWGEEKKHKHICGNSISAAYITGYLCNIILQCDTKTSSYVISYALKLAKK